MIHRKEKASSTYDQSIPYDSASPWIPGTFQVDQAANPVQANNHATCS